MILEWIRFAAGTLLILGGLCVEIFAVTGVFRFNYVMNRMHIAATGDTLGLMSLLLGLMFFSGFTVMSAKLLLILAFFWLASPVTGHMAAEIEIVTNDHADNEFEVTKP